MNKKNFFFSKFHYKCSIFRYQMAEDIDAQLKRMSEDLKEIIEQINSVNKQQDPNDPVSLPFVA